MKPSAKIVAALFTFAAVAAVSAVPQDYFNNPDYIAYRGMGSTVGTAERNALAALSRYFQMSISVKTTERTTVAGTNAKSESALSEEMFVRSQTELFAVHYTEPTYHKEQNAYEITAFIDRKEAWGMYEPKLSQGAQAFNRFYEDAVRQSETLSKVMGLSSAAQNAKRTELGKTLDFAAALYPDGYAAYAETRNHLAEIEPFIKKLCANCFVSIECGEDFEERVTKGVEEYFSKIGVGTARENAEYKCSVSVTENEQTLPAGTFYTPSFTVAITGRSGLIFSASGQLKRVGARNERIAKQRAYSALATAVKDALDKEFVPF